MSVPEVKGMGKQKSYLDRYADTEYSLTFLPKVEITVWVDDTRAEDVARKIVEVARTGRMGDGKIFILPAQPYEAVIDLADGGESHELCQRGQVLRPLHWQSMAACICPLAPASPARTGRSIAGNRPRRESSTKPAPSAAGIRKLTSKHLVLYTDVPSSSPKSIVCRPMFDQAVPQWAAVLRHRPKQRRATGRPAHFSSAIAAGSRRSA